MACLPWELHVQKAENALGRYSELRLARCLAEPHLQPRILIQILIQTLKIVLPALQHQSVSLDAMSEQSLCSLF